MFEKKGGEIYIIKNGLNLKDSRETMISEISDL
jgi:hypothetical protein